MNAALQTTDRMRAAVGTILTGQLPKLAYLAQYECRVISATPPPPNVSGTPVRISAVPTSEAGLAVLPPLASIELWPGPSGGYAVPAPGSRIRVGFIDGEPSRPYVAGLDPEVPPLNIVMGGPAGLEQPVALSIPVQAVLAALAAYVAGVASVADPGRAFSPALIAAIATATPLVPAKLLYTP